MGGDRFGGSSSASLHHAPRRWRALPRWGRRSVRVPRLSEHARLVVLAIVVGGLTGWGAGGFLLLIDRIAAFARGPVAAALAGLGLPGLVLLPMVGGLLAALVANCLTLGSGGSGGVFGPGLYLGAMLGGAYGALAHAAFPVGTAGPGVYALAGTAAFFAASAKAPVTSVLLLLEMTGDYRILPPLLAVIAASVRVSRRMSPFSIYTLKLHRRAVPAPGQEAEPAGG